MNTLLLVGLVVLSCIAGISWLIYESVSQSFPRERKPTRYQREMEAFIEAYDKLQSDYPATEMIKRFSNRKVLRKETKRLQDINAKYDY